MTWAAARGGRKGGSGNPPPYPILTVTCLTPPPLLPSPPLLPPPPMPPLPMPPPRHLLPDVHRLLIQVDNVEEPQEWAEQGRVDDECGNHIHGRPQGDLCTDVLRQEQAGAGRWGR